MGGLFSQERIEREESQYKERSKGEIPNLTDDYSEYEKSTENT